MPSKSDGAILNVAPVRSHKICIEGTTIAAQNVWGATSRETRGTLKSMWFFSIELQWKRAKQQFGWAQTLPPYSRKLKKWWIEALIAKQSCCLPEKCITGECSRKDYHDVSTVPMPNIRPSILSIPKPFKESTQLCQTMTSQKNNTAMCRQSLRAARAHYEAT